MTRTLTDEEKKTIYDEVRKFFIEELEVPAEKVTPDARVIDDLGGDSLMYLELVDEFKKKYDVVIEMRIIGQYFQSHPVHTVAQIAQAVCDIVEGGNALIGKKP
ncbi:MAG: acyl carrier protein [bacterium]